MDTNLAGRVHPAVVTETIAVVRTGTPSVVAIGASAGGIKALQELLSALPAGFPSPVIVVQHVQESHVSVIPKILARTTSLPVTAAREGERLLPGHVYIAPAGAHLVVRPDETFGLTDEPRVNYVRPSVDVLFESIARAFGDQAIAIVLTGSGHDGELGIKAILAHGGKVIVQDPETAEYHGMPDSAIAAGPVDYVLSLAEIPGILKQLVGAE